MAYTKRIMLVGGVGAGKTTFCQALYGMAQNYRKTQSVQVVNSTIDTPGEYLENRTLYRALTVTAADADIIVLVQDCTDERYCFPPGFTGMFGKPVIGVVTKCDLATGEHMLCLAEEKLRLAGCLTVFRISSKSLAGIETVKTHLAL